MCFNPYKGHSVPAGIRTQNLPLVGTLHISDQLSYGPIPPTAIHFNYNSADSDYFQNTNVSGVIIVLSYLAILTEKPVAELGKGFSVFQIIFITAIQQSHSF